MNGLFDGFDLTGMPAQQKTVKKPKEVAAPKEKPKAANFTNQKLFTGAELDTFNIELNRPTVSTLLSKLTGGEDGGRTDAKKVLGAKTLTLEEKLEVIRAKVLEVLGKQRKNVVVIKTKEAFEEYVSAAIKFGRVAVDTETNNSTDPSTCQLMGLCLYYEGGKQAYIPINHVNWRTGERLSWQLTEQDCKEQLQRFKDAGTFICKG